MGVFIEKALNMSYQPEDGDISCFNSGISVDMEVRLYLKKTGILTELCFLGIQQNVPHFQTPHAELVLILTEIAYSESIAFMIMFLKKILLICLGD